MLVLRKLGIAVMVVWILSVLALSPTASALGVAPGITEIAFTPGLERTVNMKIVNDENSDILVHLSVEGELADYVSFEENSFIMKHGETEKKIKYYISLPEKIDEPGPHEARILISSSTTSETGGGTVLNAKVVFESLLSVFVPYPGSYAKIRLLAPDFEVGKQSSFGIEINNLGENPIFAKSIVNIRTPLEAIIASLKGNDAAVESKEKEMISIPYTPETAGRFMAAADVNYESDTARDEEEFSVGSPKIVIMDISSDNFRLGQISKFEVTINSKWNEKINDIFADFIIRDYEGKHYSKYTSQLMYTAPFGSEVIPAYLETEELSEGVYEMVIKLHYLGRSEENVFDIEVFTDRVTISSVGKFVSNTNEERTDIEELYDIIAILFVVIIVSNIIIFKKLSGRKKNYISSN